MTFTRPLLFLIFLLVVVKFFVRLRVSTYNKRIWWWWITQYKNLNNLTHLSHALIEQYVVTRSFLLFAFATINDIFSVDCWLLWTLVLSNLHIVYFCHVIRSTYGKMTYMLTVRTLSETLTYVWSALVAPYTSATGVYVIVVYDCWRQMTRATARRRQQITSST